MEYGIISQKQVHNNFTLNFFERIDKAVLRPYNPLEEKRREEKRREEKRREEIGIGIIMP